MNNRPSDFPRFRRRSQAGHGLHRFRVGDSSALEHQDTTNTRNDDPPTLGSASCPNLLHVQDRRKSPVMHNRLHLSVSLSDEQQSSQAEFYSRYGQAQRASPTLSDKGIVSPVMIHFTTRRMRKTSSTSSCRSLSENDSISCDGEEVDPSKVIPEIKIDKTLYKDQNVTQILDFLYMGDLEAANREPLLCRLNIEYIVDLSNLSGDQVKRTIRLKDCPCLCASTMKHTRIRLNLHLDESVGDGISHYFDEINRFIEGARKSNRKVLIYCVTGLILAPTITTQYMIQGMGMTLKQAHGHLTKIKPEVTFREGFQRALIRLEQKLRPKAALPGVFDRIGRRDAQQLHAHTQQAWM
ncbi:uncharacterized protein LOC129282542 [Lytechinus pictus]|uniref:uncharacterized protein LOC129282542 n=1 Tax=Lytechinus pictus TaxID=7653 RepID=UPI00240E96AB|nr:uncharacterized protein LOC129282542 [Lytechinus pictus]